MNSFYRCSVCQHEYEICATTYLCPQCSTSNTPDRPPAGVLDVVTPKLKEWQDPIDLLPIEREWFPNIPVGNTPLWSPPGLAQTGFTQLYLKDESRNPTGSLKDRASLLVAASARKWGIDEVCAASTGNAGSSLAGIGAAAGLQITLFLPQSAPEAKIVQARQYGARVIPVAGTYDQAFDLCLDYARKTGVLCRNTAYNPLTIEGKKTAAIEIYQQLGCGPDVVFVPCGDGVILAGLYKGFYDLHQLGLIPRIPTLYAVQASGSNALCRAMQSGKFQVVSGQTIADSINVDIPRNGLRALAWLKACAGKAIEVTDRQILKAQMDLASRSGVFAEPAAAAAYAGFTKVKETLAHNAIIVLLMTGNGLKDVASASRLLPPLSNSVLPIEDII